MQSVRGARPSEPACLPRLRTKFEELQLQLDSTKRSLEASADMPPLSDSDEAIVYSVPNRSKNETHLYNL